MDAPIKSNRIYRFGLFEADLSEASLFRQGMRVRLQDQPFRILAFLLERAGEVVTREELRQKLWPADTYVEFDGSLNTALKRLRAALGDSADNPIFIERVPKRGYRFIAPITIEDADAKEPFAEIASTDSPASQTKVADQSAARGLHTWQSVFAVLLLVISFFVWRYSRTSQTMAASGPRVIAVLPFANNGAGADLDYLRYTIANELVTDLTHARSVTVRPFASTTRYGSVAVDPVTAGRELRVTHVLTGGFLIDNHKIRVNLELVDVARNEPVWRDEIEVSPQELIELRSQLAGRAAQGLLPALNIPGVLYGVPTPKNERAFTIYSHSLGISDDPGPNATAINMLEQSVSMDGEYAPPWEALTWRYYVDYAYGDGGPPALEKMRRAHARHAQLDPNGTANTITIRTEQGQLLEAYDEAANLLKRRPDASNAHFEMSYVLRYAGLADDASSECDAALAIDPGYAPYRSCGSIFTLGAADSVHAARYIQLDEGSGFGAMLRLEIDLRTGKTAAALNESRIAMQNGVPWATLVYRFLNHAPVEDLNKIAADIEADPKGARDSEVLYRDAAAFSFCGLKDAALRELRKAIAGSYCSYPAIDKDPLFDPIRQRPEFTSLRQSAIRCQANFRAHQNQSNSTSLAFSAGKN